MVRLRGLASNDASIFMTVRVVFVVRADPLHVHDGHPFGIRSRRDRVARLGVHADFHLIALVLHADDGHGGRCPDRQTGRQDRARRATHGDIEYSHIPPNNLYPVIINRKEFSRRAYRKGFFALRPDFLNA